MIPIDALIQKLSGVAFAAEGNRFYDNGRHGIGLALIAIFTQNPGRPVCILNQAAGVIRVFEFLDVAIKAFGIHAAIVPIEP